MNSNKLVIGGVVVALLVSVFAAVHSGQPGRNGRDGSDGLGALVSDTIPGNRLNVNGVANIYFSAPYRSATTTLCALRPQATSTLVSFTGKPSSATSTSVLLVLDKSTIAYAPAFGAATSTGAVAVSILASGDDSPFTYYATSTASNTVLAGLTSTLSSLGEFTPSDYLLFYAAKGGSGSISGLGTGGISTGKCSAVWQELQ